MTEISCLIFYFSLKKYIILMKAFVSFFQFEAKSGKATVALSPSETLDASDLKVALKKEREEHQHLLAESYAAVMDLTKQVLCVETPKSSDVFTSSSLVVEMIRLSLTKQLQIGERNWGREKLELLERFSRERAQWEQRVREATAPQEKVGRA